MGIKMFTPVPMSNNAVGSFQDMGMGPTMRTVSWDAYQADTSPMPVAGETSLVRDETGYPMQDQTNSTLQGNYALRSNA